MLLYTKSESDTISIFKDVKTQAGKVPGCRAGITAAVKGDLPMPEGKRKGGQLTKEVSCPYPQSGHAVFHLIPLVAGNFNGPRFAAVGRADNAAAFHCIDEAGRAAITDIQTALEIGRGSLAGFHNQLDCGVEQFVVAVIIVRRRSAVGCGSLAADLSSP